MYTSREVLRVLVADDDDDMRAFVTSTLHADGCSTVEARDGQELLDLIRSSFDEPWLRPDVVVADVKMPKLSGLGVLAALKVAPARHHDHRRLRRVHPYRGEATGRHWRLAQAIRAERLADSRSQRESRAHLARLNGQTLDVRRTSSHWQTCHRRFYSASTPRGRTTPSSLRTVILNSVSTTTIFSVSPAPSGSGLSRVVSGSLVVMGVSVRELARRVSNAVIRESTLRAAISVAGGRPATRTTPGNLPRHGIPRRAHSARSGRDEVFTVGPLVAFTHGTMPSNIPSLAGPHDGGCLPLERRCERIRSQVAIIRALADHAEALSRAVDADAVADQLVEEMFRLGCRLLEAAASLATSAPPLHSGVFARPAREAVAPLEAL
jgi:CheY-like chemotaxis protein